MRLFVLSILTIFLGACNGSNSGDVTTGLESFAAKPANFRVNLTDAPIDDVQSVNVNIDHVELVLAGQTEQGRLLVSEDFGMVDLLTLQNGVLLPMEDIDIPDNQISLKQIRLVLKGTDNHLIKGDGSRCELATPSAQQSGIKIILPEPVMFEGGYSYSLVVDFDAKKSIVIKGNGGCLLKPVLKIKSFTRIPLENIDEGGGSGDGSSEDVVDGEPENSDDDGDGFDDGDVNTLPIIDEDPNNDGEPDWTLN